MPPRVVRRAVSVADLRLAAKKRLPRVVFDYIDGGADAEVTLRENCRAFEDVMFRPRSAVATRACDLRASVLGTPGNLTDLLGGSPLTASAGAYTIQLAPLSSAFYSF